MQASLSLVARLPLVPPIFGSRSELSVQTSALSPSDTSCCTEFQIPHPQPFPSQWTTSLQAPTAFQLWETRPWNPRLEFPSPSHRHGHQPHLPRPQRQSNPAWAGQELAVRSQKQFFVEIMRSESASVYHEAAPDGAAAGAASRVIHLALLHSLRPGWGQLAHNNDFPRNGRRSGKTNEGIGGASQAYKSMAT